MYIYLFTEPQYEIDRCVSSFVDVVYPKWCRWLEKEINRIAKQVCNPICTTTCNAVLGCPFCPPLCTYGCKTVCSLIPGRRKRSKVSVMLNL